MREPARRVTRQPRGSRPIVVGTDRWWWKFSGYGAVIWIPTGQRYHVHLSVIHPGQSFDSFYDAQWDGGRFGMIKPSEIRAFIDRIIEKNIQPKG